MGQGTAGSASDLMLFCVVTCDTHTEHKTISDSDVTHVQDLLFLRYLAVARRPECRLWLIYM